jgi:hypothetical protein
MPSEADATNTRIAALEERLARVEAVAEIQNLKSRYAQLVDGRYTREGPKPAAELELLAREIAELFTADGVWDGGKLLGVCEGREAISRRMSEPTLQFSWHYFVKPHIEVDGDRAKATWDLLAPSTSVDGEAFWMSGFEEDEYRRVDGMWLHSHMRLSVVFIAPYEKGWSKRS